MRLEPVMMYDKTMGVRYSYDDFTTKGHGVIEYASTNSNEDGSNRKRRPKTKSKFATRWPSVSPMKRRKMEDFSTLKKKKTSNKQNPNKEIDKEAARIFKERFPGQQPQKGQMKEIRQELLKNPEYKQRSESKQPKQTPSTRKRNSSSSAVDTLTIAMFKKRHPGQQPKKSQLQEIRQELIEQRKKIGL